VSARSPIPSGHLPPSTSVLRGCPGKVVLDVRVVTGTGGGPEKTILNSPRYLLASGYKMLCAYLHPPADPGFDVLRRKAADRAAPLISIPDHGPFDWQVVRRLTEVCRSERVVIWHGHDYKSNLLGLVIKQFWPMHLVTTLHGWGVKDSKRISAYYLLDRLTLRYYERVFCVSKDLYDQGRRAGVPAHRCELLENGIDLEEYKRRQPVELAKQNLGIPRGRFLVGAVGRLSEEKGFDLLVQAVTHLLRKGTDLGLVIIGEGPERHRLEDLIRTSGYSDRFHLAGFQAETKPWYEAMDCYALSSHSEGLPNVVLEAMALEAPVVATRVAGVPRVVRDGENGITIAPGSVSELEAGLNRLHASPELCRRFRQAARRTVEQRYSFADRMKVLQHAYDRLLCRVPTRYPDVL
jgi:glycosyltransferase involved in cell wall biosynthesis